MTSEVPAEVTQIPDEWSDPHQVLPHVSEQLKRWLAISREIETDLSVVLGGIDPDGADRVGRGTVRGWLTSLQGRLHELNHEMGRKATVWDLIAQDLQRSRNQ